MDLDSGRTAEGRTIERSSGGLSLETQVGFPPGSLLKIELPDSLLLGEVCYHHATEEGKYMVGIKVVHMLRNTGVYAHLRDALQVR